MSLDLGAGVVHQQGADQHAEGVALPLRACVLGVSVMVQTAFVGDADAVGIVATGVGAGPLDRGVWSGFCRRGGRRNGSRCRRIHVGGERHPVPAHLSFDYNIIGDTELAAQLEKEQSNTENLKETIKLLKEQIESLNSQIKRLDSNLKDKDAIIELLKERR